jgi:hypothetical protein
MGEDSIEEVINFNFLNICSASLLMLLHEGKFFLVFSSSMPPDIPFNNLE